MTTLIWLQPALTYLYPLLIGRALTVLAYRGKDKREGWLFPVYFALGSIVLFAMALVISYLANANFRDVFFPAVWLLLVFSVMVNLWFCPRITRHLVGLLLAAGVFSGISYGIWTYRSPYSLNWDWYQHQTMVRLIQEGQFSFFTSEISDTFGFNSYPPFFHTLVAVVQYPVGLTPQYVTTFWQATGFWHLLSVGLAAYALAYGFTRKHMAGALALMLSIFTFDAMISMTTYFFLPQTLAAVLFSLLVAKFFSNGLSITELVAGVVSMVLMHYLVGGVGAVILVCLWGYQELSQTKQMIVTHFPWVGLIVVVTLAGFLAVPQIDLSSLNQGEAADYTYTFGQVVEVLERSYGYLIYGLVALGVVYSLTQWNRVYGMGLVVLFGLGLMVFAQVPYALKILTLLRFFLVAYAGMGIYYLISYITNPVLKGGAILATGGALVIMLMVNIQYWKAGILADGTYSHVVKDDVEVAEAAQWLSFGKHAFLVSDPATQFFIEGMAEVDTLGGAYMKSDKRKALLLSLEQRDAVALLDAVRGLYGEQAQIGSLYVALSGRTFVWAGKPDEEQLSFSTNVWMPTPLSLDEWRFVEQVGAMPGVKEIYASPYIAVYQIQ